MYVSFTRLTRILCLYIRSFFFFFFPFPLGSASPQSPLWTSRPCSTCGILGIKNRSIIVNLLILPLDFGFDSALALFLLQSSGNVNVHACDVSVMLREQSVHFNLLLFSFVIKILL